MHKTLIAICVAAVVLGAFLFLNADGHPVYLVRPQLYSHNPNFPDYPGVEINYKRVQHKLWFHNWIHGWPLAGLARVGVLPVGYKGELLKRKGIAAPQALTSRWPFDNVPWYHTNYTALSVNALIMTIVTLDVFLFSRRLLENRFQLSISMLLTIVFMVAIMASFRNLLFAQLDWYEGVAITLVVTCILATLIRFIHACVRTGLSRFNGPKHESICELN